MKTTKNSHFVQAAWGSFWSPLKIKKWKSSKKNKRKSRTENVWAINIENIYKGTFSKWPSFQNLLKQKCRADHPAFFISKSDTF